MNSFRPVQAVLNRPVDEKSEPLLLTEEYVLPLLVGAIEGARRQECIQFSSISLN